MALFVAIVASLSLSMVNSESIYVGDSSSRTYSAAKSACSSLSSTNIQVYGQLATWGSFGDFGVISDINDQLGGGSTWIGLEDLSNEGSWEFVDGDTSYWYIYFQIYFSALFAFMD